jgi:5-methylthioadenosine/S-adenosylhomocysteine deaminase
MVGAIGSHLRPRQGSFGVHLGARNPERDPSFVAAQDKFTYSHWFVGPGQAAPAFCSRSSRRSPGFNPCMGLDTHSNDLLEDAKLAVLYDWLRHELGVDTDVRLARRTVWYAIRAVTLNSTNGLAAPT